MLYDPGPLRPLALPVRLAAVADGSFDAIAAELASALADIDDGVRDREAIILANSDTDLEDRFNEEIVPAIREANAQRDTIMDVAPYQELEHTDTLHGQVDDYRGEHPVEGENVPGPAVDDNNGDPFPEPVPDPGHEPPPPTE